MFPSTITASVWLCCLTAVLVSLQPADASNSLKFVTAIRVRGCPLTVYFHDTSRSFYLSPAFCITRDIRSLLTDATLNNDSFIGGSYLNFRVLISDSLLLGEARMSLAPYLQNRSLEFLQVLSSRTSDDWSVPMTMSVSGQHTGFVRISCRVASCQDLISDINFGGWLPIEKIQFRSTVRIPGSQLIELKHPLSIAHRSQLLLKQSSKDVLYGDRCYLRLHEIIKLNESCYATVLRSSYRRSHFVVEPVLCYEGQHSTHLDVMTLTLETKTEQVRDILRRRLPSALQIDFLNVVSADVRVSTLLSGRWTFEPLRLAADGNRAELRVRWNNLESRERLVSTLARSPSEVLRHVRFRLESQLRVGDNSFCTWMSQALPLTGTEARNVAQSKLSDYHPINGLLCIKPAFKRVLAPMSDSLCAIMCSAESNCQAFSTVSGSCELFLFDKCSLNVRDCGCTRRGRVFVRRRERLEPGQLCPWGFGHDLCGVKYRLTRNSMNWDAAMNRSNQQPGLVIMADVMDRTELLHIASTFRPRHPGNVMWLGGAQLPGSAEPAGGWFWVSCNRPVSMSSGLWGSGQPDNNLQREHVIDIGRVGPVLNDETRAAVNEGYLNKCVSPF